MFKTPRDVSGRELTRLLNKYGYEMVREVGSHIRLVSTQKGPDHKVTIPDHRAIKVGTLNNVLHDISEYLGIPKQELTQELFE